MFRNPDDRLRFTPDETGGGTPAAPAATAPAAPAEGSQPAATSTSAAAVAASQATTPATAAGALTGAQAATAATGAPAPAAAPSWLDSFRKAGFNAPADENVAREQLLQSHRDAERLRPLATHLSAYQQHAAEFQQYLAEKQKRTSQPENTDWTARLGWNPPVYDPNLRYQVTTDAQGNIVPVPGAPPDVVSRYQTAQAFRQETVEKFLQNPFKFMEPAIRHIAGEIAVSQAQQGVGQYKEQQEAQSFVQQHSSWLFEQDGGKVKTQSVINPQTGRYESQQILSHWGKEFLNALQDAAKYGLPPEKQQDYALKAVQNSYMASDQYADEVYAKRQAAAAPAAASKPAETPRQAANSGFLQRANPANVPSPSANGGNAVPAPQTVNKMNLEQVMLKRFQDEGITV